MHKKIYVAVFMMMIWIPFLSMLFYNNDMSAEKRQAKAFPQIENNGQLNINFFNELTDYFSDNFAFRQEMVTADALLKSNIFKTSNNEKVIVGKEGWLYFNETLDDYLGRNVLSSRGIHNCAKVLSLIQEYVESHGAHFIFVTAPNKNSIYPEYMPYNYIKSGIVNNYSLLKEQLHKQKVNTVDLHAEFLKDNHIMYHKKDTHWNNQGAAFACDLILDSLGKEHTDYSVISSHVEKSFSADLEKMLFPKMDLYDENIIYEKEHTCTYLGKFNSTEDLMIMSRCQGRDGSIVMYRDSFGNALIPYIADEFGKGYYTKTVPYNLNSVVANKADTVVIELAERNIQTLQEMMPVMAAPMRQLTSAVTSTDSSHTTINYSSENEGMITYYGQVDQRHISDDGDIYLRLTNDEHTYVFEAFPAGYETEDNTNSGDYCYGLQIDPENIDAGKYNIDIITEKDNMYFSSGFVSEIEIQ